MRKPRRRMTDREVLRLIEAGVYTVDTAAGVVFARSGDPLKVDPSSRQGCRDAVILQAGPKRRKIAVAKVVWMAATGCVVPPGWQVHHDNEDPHEHGFWSLLCVHRLDHGKLHAKTEEPVPF